MDKKRLDSKNTYELFSKPYDGTLKLLAAKKTAGTVSNVNKVLTVENVTTAFWKK